MNSEFIRYLLAAFLALLIDLSIFLFCSSILTLNNFFSAFFGFTSGLIVIYLLSITFVFPYRRLSKEKFGEITVFTTIGVVGLCITELSIYIGVSIIGASPFESKLAGVAITFFSNFLLRKYILFK
jgi:putative flippase GtrA